MNKYFCTAPWVHLHVWPNGKVFPCRTSLREYKNVGNLHTSTVDEVWNGETLTELRKDMLEGKPRPDICDRCYQAESIGMLSLRQYCNDKFYEEFKEQVSHPTPPMKLFYWDFRFDNTCNMACRTCGPALSSAWVDDSYRMSGKHLTENVKFVKFNKDNFNQKLVEEQILNVKEINFAGGEPILTYDHYYILNELLNKNKTDVSFTYVTNLSVLKYKDMDFTKIWPKFKEVSIGISIDDIGERAEYWRHGLNWTKFVDNLKTLKKVSEEHANIKLNFFITVSVFNVHRIDKIIEFLHEYNLINDQTLVHMYSALGYVEFLEITTLTDTMKKEAISSLNRAIDLLGNNSSASNAKSLILKLGKPITDYGQDLKCMRSIFPDEITTDVTEVGHRTKAAKHFAMLDKIRNQSVKEIAPELYELYKHYGYDDEFNKFVPFTL